MFSPLPACGERRTFERSERVVGRRADRCRQPTAEACDACRHQGGGQAQGHGVGQIRAAFGAAGDGGRVESRVQDGRTEMSFAGINYIAVLVAASVAWFFGGLWYRLLAKPWMAAHGFTSEQVRAHHGNRTAMWPLVVSFVADLIMAWMLAGGVGPLGKLSPKNGGVFPLFSCS